MYSDFSFPGSFRGENAFFKYVKSVHPQVTRREIKNFLMKTDSYTLHRPKRKVKQFRKIFVKGIGYQMQLDLVDMLKYKSQNDGYAYMLNIIGKNRLIETISKISSMRPPKKIVSQKNIFQIVFPKKPGLSH